MSVLGATETDITRPSLEPPVERPRKRLAGVGLKIAVDAGRQPLNKRPGARLRAIREAHRPSQP